MAVGGSEKEVREGAEKGIEKEVDVFRDTPIRLLGYANEVGEAFRVLVPVSVVRLSYGISSAYVLADTYDKACKAASKQYSSSHEKNKKVAIISIDTLTWQAFASVIIPGFTVNRICAASNYILKIYSTLPPITNKWLTTFIGLACIPFIFKPIDNFVDYTMDNTVRKVTMSTKFD